MKGRARGGVRPAAHSVRAHHPARACENLSHKSSIWLTTFCLADWHGPALVLCIMMHVLQQAPSQQPNHQTQQSAFGCVLCIGPVLTLRCNHFHPCM